MINRRSLITGLISFVAAPAIVRASSLMPVRAIKEVKWNLKFIGPKYVHGTLQVGDWITCAGFNEGEQEFIITAISEKDIYVDNT